MTRKYYVFLDEVAETPLLGEIIAEEGPCVYQTDDLDLAQEFIRSYQPFVDRLVESEELVGFHGKRRLDLAWDDDEPVRDYGIEWRKFPALEYYTALRQINRISGDADRLIVKKEE